MSPQESYDLYAIGAKLLARERARKEWEATRLEGNLPNSLKHSKRGRLPQREDNFKLTQHESDSSKLSLPPPPPPVDPSKLKVCIVGAGTAGLYAARMLNYLGIAYDLYEASNRVGGRVRTHKFSSKPHDYYDIGAMRFPSTPIMERTFKLFEELKVPLLPYYLDPEGEHGQPSRYNDKTLFLYPKEEKKLKAATKGYDPERDDPFKVSVSNNGPVPDDTVRDAGQLLKDAYAPYREKLKRDSINGFKYLMRHDRWTVRSYLEFVEGLDYESIHWLETLNSATGWFDNSFSDNIMEDLAFEYYKEEEEKEEEEGGKTKTDLTTLKSSASHENYDEGPKCWEPDRKWYCVDGGTEVLTQNMLDKWNIKVKLNSPVKSFKLEFKPTEEPEEKSEKKPEKIVVKYEDSEDPTAKEIREERYDAVINTTTLAALQKMDLTELKLSYATKTAVRSLRYDTSTKVAIKFKEGWWMQDKYKSIRGGLGKTDMPLRVCVYPSYNIGDKHCDTNVLLCSYTWGQDSERIASLVDQDKPKDEPDKPEKRIPWPTTGRLKDLMLDNLARLHDYDGKSYDRVLKDITDLYIEHHGYDWSTDEHSGGGAFALFGPGQFSKLYPHIIRPSADSRFHIVGEHASCHHAWIAGALNSSYRGVYMLLKRFELEEEIKRLKEEFGLCYEIDEESAYLQTELGKMDPKKQPKVPLGSG